LANCARSIQTQRHTDIDSLPEGESNKKERNLSFDFSSRSIVRPLIADCRSSIVDWRLATGDTRQGPEWIWGTSRRTGVGGPCSWCGAALLAAFAVGSQELRAKSWNLRAKSWAFGAPIGQLDWRQRHWAATALSERGERASVARARPKHSANGKAARIECKLAADQQERLGTFGQDMAIFRSKWTKRSPSGGEAKKAN